MPGVKHKFLFVFLFFIFFHPAFSQTKFGFYFSSGPFWDRGFSKVYYLSKNYATINSFYRFHASGGILYAFGKFSGESGIRYNYRYLDINLFPNTELLLPTFSGTKLHQNDWTLKFRYRNSLTSFPNIGYSAFIGSSLSWFLPQKTKFGYIDTEIAGTVAFTKGFFYTIYFPRNPVFEFQTGISITQNIKNGAFLEYELEYALMPFDEIDHELYFYFSDNIQSPQIKTYKDSVKLSAVLFSLRYNFNFAKLKS